MKRFFLFAFLAFSLLFTLKSFAVGFSPEAIFPAWGDGGKVQGVIGSNYGSLQEGRGKLILYFIPKAINLLIIITAPLIFVMFVYAGIRFISAGNDEEQYKKAREFFIYGTIGLIFIVLSYSIMKAIYFLFQ